MLAFQSGNQTKEEMLGNAVTLLVATLGGAFAHQASTSGPLTLTVKAEGVFQIEMGSEPWLSSREVRLGEFFMVLFAAIRAETSLKLSVGYFFIQLSPLRRAPLHSS